MQRVDWSKVPVGTEIEWRGEYKDVMIRTFIRVEGSRIDYVIHPRNEDVIEWYAHASDFKPKYKVLIEV